jgi:hypothetical protein
MVGVLAKAGLLTKVWVSEQLKPSENPKAFLFAAS